MDTLHRVVRIGLLYDHYGPLLTDHQNNAIDLYYLQNLSLQEIADIWRTTRQAVHDLINRTVHTLEEYENKLGLLAREQQIQTGLTECLEWLENARYAWSTDPAAAEEPLGKAVERLKELLELEPDADADADGG